MAEHKDRELTAKIVDIFYGNGNEWLSEDAIKHQLFETGEYNEETINKNVNKTIQEMVNNEKHGSVYEADDNENHDYQKGGLKPQLFARDKNDYRLSDKYYEKMKSDNA